MRHLVDTAKNITYRIFVGYSQRPLATILSDLSIIMSENVLACLPYFNVCFIYYKPMQSSRVMPQLARDKYFNVMKIKASLRLKFRRRLQMNRAIIQRSFRGAGNRETRET
jgi:hypothetical protein